MVRAGLKARGYHDEGMSGDLQVRAPRSGVTLAAPE
jgi:hypothetical protein